MVVETTLRDKRSSQSWPGCVARVCESLKRKTNGGLRPDEGVLQLLRGGTITTDKDMRDNLNPKAINLLEQPAVVVEMTPYFRYRHPENGWTFKKAQSAIGRKVRVTGQLMVDNGHLSEKQDCALAATGSEKKSCWRASVWEVHPVTKFEVCSANDCGPDSHAWVELKDIE